MIYLKFFKINHKKTKYSRLLLILTLIFCVMSLTIAMLMIRTKKMARADVTLQHYGNYDVAFCEVTEEIEKRVTEDERFSQLGCIYDLGQVSFADSENFVELGAVENKETEEMFYINPIKGRYPKKKGEICIDRITLKCSGYEMEIGQRIKMSCPANDGSKFEEREYTLVGIIEVQKTDMGEVYCPRNYPEEMFSVNNVNVINYPFAYISQDEAKERYSCDKKHILANVASEENSNDVVESYLYDEEISNDLHVAADRSFGREWTVINILGSEKSNDYSSRAEMLEKSIENGEITEDVYSKYLISFFILLIGIVTSVGIFDAVRISTDECRENYGILLGMGMTAGCILRNIVIEFLGLFIVGTVCGWFLGNLCYQGILLCIKVGLGVTMPSALELDAYYAPYIKMVTKNPYLWSAGTVLIVTCVGIAGAVRDLLHMTPLGLMASKIHKRKRKRNFKGLYAVLNRYVGRESSMNHWIPYVMVSLVMAVSVFGFLFFHEKSIDETSDMTEQIEDARINGMDYYMKQTDDVYSGYLQYKHDSGVTPEIYQKLEQNSLVETVRGVIIDHSTALVYDKDEMISSALQPQTEYFEAISNSAMDQILVKANLNTFDYLGVDTDKREVFHVPTVGVNQSDLDYFEQYVIAGEIHEDKLKSGEEVIVAVTEEGMKSYFDVGDSLPLYDFVRPDDIDSSTEWMLGQLPENHKDDKETFSVTVDGVTQAFWCYDTMKELSVKIGAVIYFDPIQENSLYFDDGNKNYSVNIMTEIEAFSNWNLPNKNYTRVGVTLKNIEDSERFDSQWMEIVQNAGYMESIDVYSILEEKETMQQQVMAIFYTIIGVLLIISLLCIGNSIVMRIRQMAEEQKVLHLLGMTRRRILFMYIRRYSFTGLIGAVVSIFPVTVYSFVVRYALKLTTQAYENDMTDVLQIQKPWIYELPKYDMLNWLFAIVVIVVCILAVALLIFLVLTQSGQIEKVLSEKEKSEE